MWSIPISAVPATHDIWSRSKLCGYSKCTKVLQMHGLGLDYSMMKTRKKILLQYFHFTRYMTACILFHVAATTIARFPQFHIPSSYSVVTVTMVLSIQVGIISTTFTISSGVSSVPRLTESNIVFDMLGLLFGIWIIPSSILEFSFCLTVSLNTMESTK